MKLGEAILGIFGLIFILFGALFFTVEGWVALLIMYLLFK